MNPKLMKIAGNWRIWAALAAVVFLWMVHRNGRRWWTNLTRRDMGNYDNLPRVEDNPIRESELQALAQQLYAELRGLPGWNRSAILNQAYALSDPELRYVAEFYRRSVSPNGHSLKQDLQDEWFLGDIGDKLIASLTRLAL